MKIKEVKKLNLKRQEGFLEAKLGWRRSSAEAKLCLSGTDVKMALQLDV